MTQTVPHLNLMMLNSVSTMPGWISDTRIGVATSSLRRAEVKPLTANLEALSGCSDRCSDHYRGQTWRRWSAPP